jgi:hypothetical protein
MNLDETVFQCPHCQGSLPEIVYTLFANTQTPSEYQPPITVVNLDSKRFNRYQQVLKSVNRLTHGKEIYDS